MGLDNSTLFIANITVLLVSVAACAGVWIRSRSDALWPTWIAANLALAFALFIYVAAPGLPPLLAIWPDALLILGMSLRIVALRHFGRRHRGATVALLLPLIFVALAYLLSSHSRIYGLANVLLTAQMLIMAHEVWRGRADGLPSRIGLVAVSILMAASFAARAAQGFLAADQIVTYIPFDTLLQVHLLVALVYVAASSLFVLSLASERAAGDLARAAFRDSLTGLPNRRAFEEHLRGAIEGRRQQQFAVCLLDVDRFKMINDKYGHAAGDAVLRRIGEVLQEVVGGSDHAARIGGEEFALILQRVTPEEAFAFADHVRTAIATAVTPIAGHLLRVTVSAGLAHSTLQGDADRMVAAADQQLYRSKESGRDKTSGASECQRTDFPTLKPSTVETAQLSAA